MDSAESFDRGRDGEAKRLAVSVRVLCHDTQNSHSLLGQLGRLGGQFLSTAILYDPRNIMPHNGLAVMAHEKGETAYRAMLDQAFSRRLVPFGDWWNEVVFSDRQNARLTRRDLVLAMANQDGGAHVDPALNNAYARLSRKNSMGWAAKVGAVTIPMAKPERAAMRQIAHELLASLVPGYAKQPAQGAEAYFAAPMIFEEDPRLPAQGEKLGRNDPCWCGGGKKFKKCHGAG